MKSLNIYVNVIKHIHISIFLNINLLKLDYIIDQYARLMETKEMTKQ